MAAAKQKTGSLFVYTAGALNSGFRQRLQIGGINGWQFTVHSKEGARLGRVRVNRPKGAAPPPPKDKDGRPTL